MRDVGMGIPFDEVSPVECVPFVDNSQACFVKSERFDFPISARRHVARWYYPLRENDRSI